MSISGSLPYTLAYVQSSISMKYASMYVSFASIHLFRASIAVSSMAVTLSLIVRGKCQGKVEIDHEQCSVEVKIRLQS